MSWGHTFTLLPVMRGSVDEGLGAPRWDWYVPTHSSHRSSETFKMGPGFGSDLEMALGRTIRNQRI